MYPDGLKKFGSADFSHLQSFSDIQAWTWPTRSNSILNKWTASGYDIHGKKRAQTVQQSLYLMILWRS